MHWVMLMTNYSLFRKMYDRCVPVKTKRIKPKQQPWFHAEIKALIMRRDSAYRRYIHKFARTEVTRQIKIAKALYYGGQFSNAMDNRSKWNVIREEELAENVLKQILM